MEISSHANRAITALEIAERQNWEVKSLPVWEPGDEILRLYQVEKVISGGMGHVYIANHKKWNRKLAIKSPNETMLSDRDLFSRILREANSWVEMGMHPNIAYCYYVRNIEGVPHIVVEYVDGGNLREWIKEGRCIDYRVNLNLAIQFCHGMEFAHSKGMIHRDIKPENVLMTKEWILKITDFGLVRSGKAISEAIESGQGMTQERNQPLTTVGDFMGTEGYVSPEQAENPHEVDERADIFSFGVCLYEMFCGNRPYRITYGPRQKPPDPIALSKDENFPKPLGEILEKCVQWSSKERYKSFIEIRMELLRIYNALFKEESPYENIELVGLEADGLNNQGVSYMELGQYDKARELFEKAVAMQGLHPQANWNLGNLSVLNQSIAHLEWRDVTTGMLRNILRHCQLSEEDVEQRVQRVLRRNRFVDGVVIALERRTGHVRSVCFSPDGHFLASASGQTVKLWDAQSGQLSETLKIEGFKNYLLSVAFSPDGQFLASGSTRKMLKLWDAQSGQVVKNLKGHRGFVTSVAFSPDGQFLTSGNGGEGVSGDRTVKLWDVKSGQIVKNLEGHKNIVKSVAFSPNGKFLASGSYDKTVKLWDTHSGQLVKTLEGHTGMIWSVIFSRDGQFLASYSHNGVRLWLIIPELEFD